MFRRRDDDVALGTLWGEGHIQYTQKYKSGKGFEN